MIWLHCIFILLTRSVFIFLAGIALFFVGLPVVAIALPFRTVSPRIQTFAQFPGYWKLVSLPRWALWWDNPADGMLGDTRGWWDNYCKKNYSKPCTAFYSMWQWAAIRNSANYWSRVVSGVDASRCSVLSLASGANWQFLVGVRDDGKLFPLFEGFIPYGDKSHGVEWRFGWKVELGEVVSSELPLTERSRGSVFRFRPWKAN